MIETALTVKALKEVASMAQDNLETLRGFAHLAPEWDNARQHAIDYMQSLVDAIQDRMAEDEASQVHP